MESDQNAAERSEIIVKAKSKQNPLKEVWRRFKRNKMAVFGLCVLAFLVFTALFADFIAPYHFDDQDLRRSSLSPSRKHLMGTDNFGRDIFSRIVYGSRVSLQVGFVSIGISTVLGGGLGAVAGFYGGRTDDVIMRCMDVLLAIPGMVLAIAIAASLGTSLTNMMIAIGLGATPGFARVTRAVVLTVKEMEFIEAARSVGASDARIIMKHVIPNTLAPIIVQVTLNFARSILSAASLSFLGLGVKPPIPEWGSMLSSSRQYLRDYWFMSVFPGLTIMLTVYSLNLLGDGLRDALDPRLKN